MRARLGFWGLALGLWFWASTACARIDSGWWWNPAEAGRGFFIEEQGSSLFLVAYLYDSSGRATWAISQLSSSTENVFAGALSSFSGGQTLTGSFQPNQRITPDLGSVRLVFSDPAHARLEWPGGTLLIERFALVTGGLDAIPAAGDPESGWWWNPAEPGRGYSIEIQNGVLFVGAYMYDQSGAPIWYASGQAAMLDPRNYRGQWQQYANGQTLTGAYRPATLVNPAVGPMALQFTSSISATLAMPDGRLNPISRFVFGTAAPITWSPALSAIRVAIAGRPELFSSTRLRLQWNPPTVIPDHYVVTVTDVLNQQRRDFTTSTPGLDLDGLAAATDYRIELTACPRSGCLLSQTSSLTTTTPTETWVLQGSGKGINGLRRVVADGNVKIHAIRFGQGAPADLLGKVQLYYGAFGMNVRGLATAITPVVATAANPDSYLQFTSRAGSSGLISPPMPAALVSGVATGQAVPLRDAGGTRIRLYFEANGADNKTRILSVEGQDGAYGLDFNSGNAGVCASTADYSSIGGCAPSVVIGVAGDTVNGNPGFNNARQFKLGFPTADDWRWDGTEGTFMVFTVDALPGCTTASHNQAYAVYRAGRWQVQYAADGCPKMLKSMQAAHPLHLSAARYKLYYGDVSDRTGALPGSGLPFLGRKKLLYADGVRTGLPTEVDFEDWEPVSAGRRINFLWPDGSTLDASAEGYIDDFSVITPTADLALQVLYIAITDGRVAPFTAAAVLANP